MLKNKRIREHKVSLDPSSEPSYIQNMQLLVIRFCLFFVVVVRLRIKVETHRKK